ncbi:MAG: tape measure protein [Aristaeellaceae bacterium]
MSDGRIVFSIEGDSSGLSNDLDNASNIIAKKTAGWSAVADAAVDGIKNLAVKAASGVKSLITNAIDYNAKMETYVTSFATMLGSAEAAEAKVEELKAFAASTPFAMDDLASATQTLLAFGIASEDASVYLKQLGDISQGDSTKLNSLTLAFAQISSAGKLSGQDLLQMINAGFNPLQQIAEVTGASIGDLKEAMAGGKGSAAFQAQVKAAQQEVKKLGNNASAGAKMLAQIGDEGQISADLVAEAMRLATEEGGLFYGAMEKQSQTYLGQMSTLKDNLAALNASVFRGVFDKLATDVLPLANQYVSRLQSAFDAGGLSGMLGEAKNILSELAVSIKPPPWEDIKSEIASWWDGIVAPMLVNVLVATFGVEPDKAETIISTLTGFAGGIVTAVEDFFRVTFAVLTGDEEKIRESIATLWSHLEGAIQGFFKKTFGIELPSAQQVIAGIRSWWSGVKSQVSLTLGIGVEQPSTVHTTSTGREAGGGTGKTFASGGILTGTRRLLSQGGDLATVGEAGAEAVLPLDILWQRMGLMLDASMNAHLARLEYSLAPQLPSVTLELPSAPSGRQEDTKPAALDIDYDRLTDTLTEAMEKISIRMDGQAVGKLVTPSVSREMGKSLMNRRYT